MIILIIYGRIYKNYNSKGVMSMENTINRVRKFRKDREWDQFHSPSNLAKAISIEAAELLEEFLWDNENYNKQNVEEELADVMVYCLHMADALNVDINEIINKNMDKNEKNIQLKKPREIVKSILNYNFIFIYIVNKNKEMYNYSKI